MNDSFLPLSGQTVLITGGVRRLGRIMALAAAKNGADILLHHAHSPIEAFETAEEITKIGRKVWVLEADFSKKELATQFIDQAFQITPITALINNAAVFSNKELANTSLAEWDEHLQINLTMPFLLSQAFAAQFKSNPPGRIINILDWRAIRPAKDHFAYTISKAALAAMTQSTAHALAPNIAVNGLALGAILPPSDQNLSDNFLNTIPMKRWADLSELEEMIVFLLSAPTYLTGEIIHLDGGRHLI